MRMTDQIKEIIADFHERPIPLVTPRDIQYEIVAAKITTLTGVRRAGKTFLLFQIMQSLIDGGLAKQNIFYLNFEDDRLDGVTLEELSKIFDIYFELYPAKKKERIYVFLDEIHNISGWEKFVRRIQDNENAQIFVTGSSAKLLSREIATSLRGRCINYEVFPFSFEEFLRHKGIERKDSSSGKALIKSEFNNFMKYGSFPEIIGLSERVWRKVLQDYMQLILYRDVIERHNIKNHSLIKYFIKHLLKNISSPLSINKLYNDLKSQGFSVGKDTLHQYLNYVEDAYAFFAIPVFSTSLRVQQVNYRKLYCVDIGLSEASILGISEKQGALLENLVFLELKRDDSNRLYYYKTNFDHEIDFLVVREGAVRRLIQVSINLDDCREREITALYEAMEEMNMSSAEIITCDAEDHIKKSGREISIVPFWKWVNHFPPLTTA